MTALKTIFFSVLVPGTVVGLVPLMLLEHGPALRVPWIDTVRYVGVFPILFGIMLYLASAWNFVTKGKGTPAPIDPPRLLVVSGPYRFVRNPMYAGGIFILLGETLVFGSGLLALYLCFIWLVFHLFVVLYEEPHLRKVFGEGYVEYCQEVNRWIPAAKKRG